MTDAMATPGVTTYAYDEVGDRITQTDANNHATTYQYDQRGRRTQRKLPLGQTESYTYDANGNLATRTDFNGRVTTYAYDSMNRLLSKTPDPYFVQNHIGAALVSYTYDSFGRRSGMTDASGTTAYAGYDNNGHPNQVYKPAGTLTYNYDVAGNLKIFSGGNNVSYSYDALERMSTVAFSDRVGTYHTATYAYDLVGNLQTVTYPNGVVHNYTYDTRNRLANLGVNGTVNGAPGAIAGYAYTLDAAGHRTGVTEMSGRTVSYGYDNLYRLTNETIASDPSGMNGAVTYTYDPVGNRTQKVSTLPGYPGGLSNYNANDQLSTDTYDSDGNTTASNGTGYVYDFENRLVQAGAGITIVYDGDGNRVSKTVAGVTTAYLVDSFSPTGYAQVVYEGISGSTAPNREQSHTFSYGLELVNEARTAILNGQLAYSTIYFDYDGHGSVRALTDATGTVTDTYDYDAFGNLIHSTGTTPNNYLFAGEQFDPDLNLYYNRARYLNTSTGRFWTMDTFEGDEESPLSLHKYAYVLQDPTNGVDPSGLATMTDVVVTISVDQILEGFATLGYLLFASGILTGSDREPYISRRDREENPGRWLYAFGNNSRGPSGPRILGYNGKPGRTVDISVGSDGMVGPQVPPNGASSWSNPETAPVTGYVFKVRKDYVQALPTLGVWADGSDAVPAGPNPPGHHIIYPTIRMTPFAFDWSFKTLPWLFVYRKKNISPVNLS